MSAKNDGHRPFRIGSEGDISIHGGTLYDDNHQPYRVCYINVWAKPVCLTLKERWNTVLIIPNEMLPDTIEALQEVLKEGELSTSP